MAVVDAAGVNPHSFCTLSFRASIDRYRGALCQLVGWQVKVWLGDIVEGGVAHHQFQGCTMCHIQCCSYLVAHVLEHAVAHPDVKRVIQVYPCPGTTRLGTTHCNVVQLRVLEAQSEHAANSACHLVIVTLYSLQRCECRVLYYYVGARSFKCAVKLEQRQLRLTYRLHERFIALQAAKLYVGGRFQFVDSVHTEASDVVKLAGLKPAGLNM